MRNFVISETSRFFKEVYEIYENECRALTEEARKINPSVSKVEPVRYNLYVENYELYKECLLVYMEGSSTPHIYVIDEDTAAGEPDLTCVGKEVYPDDENLPIPFEEAVRLYQMAEIILNVDRYH